MTTFKCPEHPRGMWCEAHQRHWSVCLKEPRDVAVLQVEAMRPVVEAAVTLTDQIDRTEPTTPFIGES